MSRREEEGLYRDQDVLSVEVETLAWILGRVATPAYAITEEVATCTPRGEEPQGA